MNDKKTPSKIFQINNQTNGGKGEILHHSSVCFSTIWYNFHFHFLVMSKNSVFVYLGFHRSPHSMCVQWFCSQTEIPCGHCNTKEKNNIYIWEQGWSAESVCVETNGNEINKMPRCCCFFFILSALQKLCKNSLTYFGDSGVKGSGKMVGLAAEHKGAWVINLLVHTVPKIFQVHIYN